MEKGEKYGRDAKWIAPLIFILLFAVVITGLYKNKITLNIGKDDIYNFSTVFLSIILEALPFILLGSFVSAFIQVFISEQTIAKLIPKNKLLGLFAASLMGFVFPVCECAIVPIGRRLIKKGVPLNIAVTFMLAVPIVNPIVLASTYYAFYDKPEMLLIRGVFGLLCSITVGFIVGWMEGDKNPMVVNSSPAQDTCSCSHKHNHTHCHHDHNHGILSRITEIIEHTSIELYDIGKFLTIGALISSAFQVFVPRELILSASAHGIFSIAAMMIFAYIISLCSEADAFIARTFMGQFTTGSIAAFLILGPMIDIKNTLLLSSSFKKGFILRLIFIIFSVCFIAGTLINITGF